MSCVICLCKESVEVATRGRYALAVRNVICEKCGLVYVDPQPSKEELAAYYDKEFRQNHIRRDKDDPTMILRRNIVVRLLKNFLFADMNILEIGCADGALLDHVGQLAETKNLFGIEPTSELAKKAHEDYDIDVFNGMFADYETQRSDFDLIIMQHVLEHCSDPLETLIQVRKLMNENSYLYLEVPDAREPYGDFVYGFLQVPHLFSFTRKTLKLLFSIAGFEVAHMAFNAPIVILKKGKEIDRKDINFFESGESYQELMHFFKVYTEWFRSKNQPDEKIREKSEARLIADDNQLAKRIVKMHSDVLKSRLKKELDEHNLLHANTVLNLIENQQNFTTLESVEFLLLQAKVAKVNKNKELIERNSERIGKVKKLIEEYEGSK